LTCLVLAILGIPPTATTSDVKHTIASFKKYLEIPGAKPIGSDNCANCHDAVAKNFQHVFHAQQGVECEDCHGAGSLHVDGGGDISKIVSFKGRTPEQANGVCLSCHAQHEKIRNWIAGSHAANHVRCLDCHQIHTAALVEAKGSKLSFDQATRGALRAASVSPETNAIVRPMWETNEACLKCHPTQSAQLSMPYHHPLREGKMSCVDCHDPHGGAGGRNLKISNVNQLCLGCHAQYRGPFAYQHPPVSENCMLCHTAHGSPNTNLLSVSEPALCLQCHAGHHNGAGLPLADRCTNCHGSIHGTDVPTPSGGSRFLDKGPSESQLLAGAFAATGLTAQTPISPRSSLSSRSNLPSHSNIAVAAVPPLIASHAPTLGIAGMAGMLGLTSSASTAPLAGGPSQGGAGAPGGTEISDTGSSAASLTFGQYRFVDGTGFLGRVGEYDSLDQSAGADMSQTFVSTVHNLTVASRANVLTGADYSAASQLTWGERLQINLFLRSFVQQQDHYQFYAFPVLDVPPGSSTPPDSTTDLIPGQSLFGVTRRLGNVDARFKVPKLPVRLFVNGGWQARAGSTQFAYLDENTVPLAQQACGFQCHFQSQLQPVNYTTRNVGGGAQVDLRQLQITYEHDYSSFNDRLAFPTANFTGEFDPSQDPFGYSSLFPVTAYGGKGPTPGFVGIGNYPIDIPSPNEASTDRLGLNWTASPSLSFNGNVSYTRVRNRSTHYSQNWFDTDNTLNWRPMDRLRLTLDYHQHNLINDFVPYYTMYGNVSYHNHSVGVLGDYELPKGFDIEAYYQRGGITRSNAFLWPQFYSVDNTDLLKVAPSSYSNTTGLALRYHDRDLWSARVGYEWTGTHDPGYLTVPGSNNRAFVDVWLTPARWLVFSNDFSAIVQNAFPAVALPDTANLVPPTPPTPLTQSFGYSISGLPSTFERRNRFYFETLSATFRFVPDWNLGLGYSYQHNNLATYMAFQNDFGPGYILDEPLVPYKQITQAYWADSSYLVKRRFGVNLKVTYNSSRSGFRPDVNAADTAKMGNACLIAGTCVTGATFDPNGLFPSALSNLQFSSTQISEVIVPQWIGQGKAYYLFPRRFEGGFVFYYGSYRDYWNPNLNGVLRTMTLYVGKSW